MGEGVRPGLGGLSTVAVGAGAGPGGLIRRCAGPLQRRPAGWASSRSSGRRPRSWTGSATRWRRTSSTQAPSTSPAATWMGPRSAAAPRKSCAWSLGRSGTSSTPSCGTSVSPGPGVPGVPRSVREAGPGFSPMSRAQVSRTVGGTGRREPEGEPSGPDASLGPDRSLLPHQLTASLMSSAGSSTCWRRTACPFRRPWGTQAPLVRAASPLRLVSPARKASRSSPLRGLCCPGL